MFSSHHPHPLVLNLTASLITTKKLHYFLFVLIIELNLNLISESQFSHLAAVHHVVPHLRGVHLPHPQLELHAVRQGGVQKYMLSKLVDFSIKWVGGVLLVH